jgi:hypothetical protein
MKINRLALILTIFNLAFLIFIFVQSRTTATLSTSGVLRARVIELVDERGQVRAELNVESGGEAVFRLRDEEGTIRVKLGASEDGSGLLLLNELTEPGIQLLAGRDGTHLTLTGKDKGQRVIEP